MKSPLNIDEPLPRFGWALEGKGKRQAAYRITVSSGGSTLWDSGRVESAKSSSIAYAGSAQPSFADVDWNLTIWDESGVGATETGFFRTGCLDKSLWTGDWISVDEARPVSFRKTVKLARAPEKAYLYASAQGIYSVLINGKRATDTEFSPGWTDYKQRIQYQCCDVSAFLKRGNNEIVAEVADGWYCGHIAIAGREMYGSYPLKFFAELHIDGDKTVTDGTWQGSANKYLAADMQMGEVQDLRFDAYNWRAVDTAPSQNDKLCAQCGEPIRHMLTRRAQGVHIMRPPGTIFDTRYIFDMGQNMVGYACIKARGRPGQRVVVRYGEMCNADGSLYTENLRSAKATDEFYLTGKGEEILKPEFTFHGFRYVEVTGVHDIGVDDVTGVVIYNDLGQTGHFETSNPLVNKLWENTMWSQRGNFFSIPTDCPQRDERMGWTGDAQVFCKTGCYNMASAGFYEKYLRDIFDSQREDGAISDVAPVVLLPTGIPLVGCGNTAWGDAAIIIPWTLYQMYGDIRPIERYYDNMARCIGYLTATAQESGLRHVRWTYGDWLNVDDPTDFNYVASAYYGYVVSLMAKMASLVGKKDDAKKYAAQFEMIKKGFNAEYVTPDGRVKPNTQAAYLMALKFELLPEELRPAAVRHLVMAIHLKNDHLSTGFVGVSYLLPVLCDYGETKLAYQLLTTDSYPSWFYPILNGATTIWERWNSYTIMGGFGDVSMNSFNHYSLGSVVEWMYTYAAGIKLDHASDGLPKLTIKPYYGAFSNLCARYDSIYGAISVEWDCESLKVTLPPNIDAEINLPDGSAEIQCNGTYVYKR